MKEGSAKNFIERRVIGVNVPLALAIVATVPTVCLLDQGFDGKRPYFDVQSSQHDSNVHEHPLAMSQGVVHG